MFVLPGDSLPPSILPPNTANRTQPLKLGPGLRHIPPSTITPTQAGELCIDHKKHALWIENNGGRYIPTTGDLVLATIHHTSPDTYHCLLTPHSTYATLPQLAFENATKKTRPQLHAGSLVYARVAHANKHMEPELECVQPATGRADGLGELKGGMVFEVSTGMARRLMMPDPAARGGVVVLEECAALWPFEVAVGRNGRVWVDAGDVRRTVLVGRTMVETDREGLGIREQRVRVGGLVRGMGL
ncbi:MAG: exosome non-catalytic core subunit rrp40 [Peltula sp. TS41687]|nr:MAG: exosome non-catalytic core subunit rrp40 [Peltula sp. TS41687]